MRATEDGRWPSMALLTYNLVNYRQDAADVELVGSRWNSADASERQGE